MIKLLLLSINLIVTELEPKFELQFENFDGRLCFNLITILNEKFNKQRFVGAFSDSGATINKCVCLFFSLKPPEDSHVKPGPPRHKQYSTPTRPTTPRTPKHRLSVDANLQIPEALNSASKKDLLRRVRH